MAVTLERFQPTHLSSPALQLFMGPIPLAVVQAIEPNGGLVRTIMLEGQIVGVVTLMLDHELMVAVHPTFHRRGIATRALELARTILVNEKGIKKLVAKTRIGSASSKLAARFGAKEVRRSEAEVFFEVQLDDVPKSNGASFMNALYRIYIAIVSVFVGLLMMGAAYDKPEWYFAALGIAGLILFVGGPLYAVFFGRGKHGHDEGA